jgi:hypothetical protein
MGELSWAIQKKLLQNFLHITFYTYVVEIWDLRDFYLILPRKKRQIKRSERIVTLCTNFKAERVSMYLTRFFLFSSAWEDFTTFFVTHINFISFTTFLMINFSHCQRRFALCFFIIPLPTPFESVNHEKFDPVTPPKHIRQDVATPSFSFHPFDDRRQVNCLCHMFDLTAINI